jgi:hypothetical protein
MTALARLECETLMFEELLQYLDDAAFKQKIKPFLVEILTVLSRLEGVISTSLFGSLAKVHGYQIKPRIPFLKIIY